MDEFDALIIGAGQAGKPLASDLANAGWKTALVERAHVGGTCINEGCTPTKTMYASARLAYLARRAGDYGVRAQGVQVDQNAVRARKQKIVDEWRDGGTEALNATENLTLLFGEARFTGPKSLSVRLRGGGERTLAASKAIVINVGGRPAVPKIPGLDEVPFLDSTTVMDLAETPRHLLVLGGGYVGCEFAQMFRRFGAQVTVVQQLPKLLGKEDDDIADEVAKIFREDGIEVLLGAEATRAEPGPRLAVTIDGGERVLEGSHLLVAAGRRSNTDALDCAAAGVHTDARGNVPVDAKLRTNVEGIWAAGDVTGGPRFTHIAYDDYRVIKDQLLGEGTKTTAGRPVPNCVFIDPQLGRVGMTEREARAAGREVRVAKLPMEHIARAVEAGETRGFLKAVLDAKTDEILGFAALGLEGGELMAMVEIAMLGKVRASQLRDAVFAHPTLAEGLNTLFA